MRITDFPEARWLGSMINDKTIVDDIETYCPEGYQFSDTSGFDKVSRDRVSNLARVVFNAGFGEAARQDQQTLDEPFYFSLLAASVIQGKPAGVLLPNVGKSKPYMFDDQHVDGYLRAYDKLDNLIETYLKRINGGFDANRYSDDPVTRYARLMSGATFLLIDTSNAQKYQDECLDTIAEMEKQFLS